MSKLVINDNAILSKSEKMINVVIHIVLILLCICCLYAFLIVLGSSFQTQEDIMTNGYRVIPKSATLDAYKMILAQPKDLINSYNITIITTVIGTLIGLWVVASYAYVLSRKNYRYRKALSFYVFFTMLFNGGLVPTYILISITLNLKDNIWALILPLLVSAWYILLMKGFFQSIPDSLLESAKIDGASEIYIFVKIVIPISKPAIATVGLFFVLQYWNDWWLSLLYIESDNLFKLQYMLMKLLTNIEYLNSTESIKMGLVREGVSIPTLSARMAMCILAAGPILFVFPFFQKYFVKGLTVGAVKG